MEFHILDNDFYKFAMQEALLENAQSCSGPDNLANMKVEYRLVNRNQEPIVVRKSFRENLDKLLQTPGLNYNESLWFKDIFGYNYGKWFCSLDKPYAKAEVDCEITEGEEVDTLTNLTIKGDWIDAILLEVPIMAFISENCLKSPPINSGSYLFCRTNINYLGLEWGEVLGIAPFAEFGTRRRCSKEYQWFVLDQIKDLPSFKGSSNVLWSYLHKTKPIGTIAHEWFLGALANRLKHYAEEPEEERYVHALESVSSFAFDAWREHSHCREETRYLTDTFTSDLFFKTTRDSFRGLRSLCHVRQDSGDPIEFFKKYCDQIHDIIFSDSLNMEKINQINEFMKHNRGRHEYMFGIGTALTGGSDPLNIVIKPFSFDGIPVCKISDSPGKITGMDSEKILKGIATIMAKNP